MKNPAAVALGRLASGVPKNYTIKTPARQALRWPNVALRPEAHERLRRAAHTRRCSMSDIILVDVRACDPGAQPAKPAAAATSTR